MSREVSTGEQSLEEEREQTVTPSGAVGGEAGSAAIDRIGATDDFWSQVSSLCVQRKRSDIDQLLHTTYKAGQLGRLVRNATEAQMGILYNMFQVMTAGGHSPVVDVALWDIFCALPDARTGLKRLCFQVRFRIDVIAHDRTAAQELEWDAASLKQLWLALSKLPNSHVENNPDIKHFIRYAQGTPNPYAGGYYESWKDKDLAAVNFQDGKIATTTQLGTSQVRTTDPLANVNRFDKVMRHEVGHAVDEKLNLNGTYCSTPAGGAWERISRERLVEDILYNAGAQLPFWDPSGLRGTTVVAAIEKLGAQTTAEKLLDEVAPYRNMGGPTLGNAKQLLPALRIVLAGWNDWGGTSDHPKAVAGKRAFSRDGNFCYSYDAGARDRQVSNYQFHSPMEWIAEAYSAYYEPDPRGRGAKLADRDPATKQWFDRNVHDK